MTGRAGLPAGFDHDGSIPPPTLNPAQQAAFERIAAEEDGAWARAFYDGTTEVCWAYRGGLRRVVLDHDGEEAAAEEFPPTRRVVVGKRVALSLLALGALGGAFVWYRARADVDVGLTWLWPAACGVTLILTLAYCFGIYSRLPGPRVDAGRWVGLPGPDEGDVSGHTMPGFVKAHPFYSAFIFLFMNAFAAALFKEKPAGIAAGLAIGTFVWWFTVLCFSRGWIKEGD